MKKSLDVAMSISGLFTRLRAIEKQCGRINGLEDRLAALEVMVRFPNTLKALSESEIPTQEELATTIPGGHSEKFEWVEWEPDYKALYESERIEYHRSEARYDDLRAAWDEDMKENDREIDRLKFFISILAAVKPLDGSVGKEVW